MPDPSPLETLRNIDRRLHEVEQFLPTLAGRTELQAAVAPLASRAELQAAIAPLVTRAELQAAIAPLATRAELQAAIAPLATRAELAALREEVGALDRRTALLYEDLRDDTRIILEHLVALSARVDDLARRLS